MAEIQLDSNRVREILQTATSLASSTLDISKSESVRVALLGLSRQLVGLLERPDERVTAVAHGNGRLMCVRVADDLNLFQLICERPRTASELATITGAEDRLLVRILRMLTAIGFVASDGNGMYSATPTSNQMTMPSVQAGVKLNFEEKNEILRCTPEYLKRNGYRLPRTGRDTPFQFFHQTTLPNHEYWAEIPDFMDNFQTFMNGLWGGARNFPWWKFYPIDDVLSTPSDVAFVDVGGGRGHEAEGVLHACPNARGRFVLQDLPEVISRIPTLDNRIERMPHDFLTLQPDSVKGSTVFFLSNILHDHPEDVCFQILSNIKPCMLSGHSRLLISNIILPEESPSLYQLDLDLSMFFLSGGCQRTKAEWTILLQSAGFHVRKFWYSPVNQNGIIEAIVPG